MTSTARSVSPDSGRPWADPGAWTVADGVHRIPLPLPNDGLRAVNVYVLTDDRGVTLIDGGWAIAEARELLERSLAEIGLAVADIDRFLVTHSHRDHYTMASVLGAEAGAEVWLGSGERASLDTVHGVVPNRMSDLLREAGAHHIARAWDDIDLDPDLAQWRYPDHWLEDDRVLTVGSRTIDAVHTPGHTQGHYVFADRPGGLLFAGDHVLPTITPSIGFEPYPGASPLGDFMASLAKVRAMPDLRLLPAHGPVTASSHARVDELLAHHEHRLDLCLRALTTGPATAVDVAGELPWTRHDHAYATLDAFNAALAAMETKAHLDVLVARGQATRRATEAGVVYQQA